MRSRLVPELICSDLERSLVFYRDLIGFRVLYARANEAKELAEKLSKQGHQVGFLAGGFLHWEADNLGIERGTPTAN